MNKTRQNHGHPRGETIDIRAVLRDCESAAQTRCWTEETFHSAGGFKWLAYRRASRIQPPACRIYISAGIHGNEPAAPLAALRLLQQNEWPADAEILLLPCLNPIGHTRNTREDENGVDLNRDYRHPQARSTRAHIAWLERQLKFDLYLCLHEDWEAKGFYLYEQNPDDNIPLAIPMIDAVRGICPIDHGEIIEGFEARGGVIRPNIAPADRPQWPEAVWLLAQKSRQGYTLESPSALELPIRVNALVAAVNTAVNLATEGRPGRRAVS